MVGQASLRRRRVAQLFVRVSFGFQTTLGRRAGWLAAIVLATSPLLLLNARHMVGAAPHFAAQAAVAYFGVRARVVAFNRTRGAARYRTCCGDRVSAFGSAAVMAGPLPPMTAIAITAWMFRARLSGATRARAVAVGVLVSVSGVMVAFAVAKDGMHYSPWLGGFPTGGDPPAFDSLIERVFHGFSPWSALLIAGAMNWAGRRNADDCPARSPFASLFCGAALGYVAATVFLSRYGYTTFYPVAAFGDISRDHARRSRR